MPASKVDLLLVRGAPGVGKSSAVKRLRRQIRGGAIIEVDSLRGMIAAVDWSNREQHSLALEHSRLVAQSFLSRGFCPVIIVDTLGHSRLIPFMETLKIPCRLASLYARPEVLSARVLGRPEGEFKQINLCLQLNEEVGHRRYEHETWIDTSELSSCEVAGALLRALGLEAPPPEGEAAASGVVRTPEEPCP